MKSRTEVTSTAYAVKLTVAQFLAIDHRDNSSEHYDGTLIYILEKMKCNAVEYNGHFGSYIYYSLRVEHDNAEHRAKIEAVILMFVKKVSITKIREFASI